jgi:hypothetical protein
MRYSADIRHSRQCQIWCAGTDDWPRRAACAVLAGASRSDARFKRDCVGRNHFLQSDGQIATAYWAILGIVTPVQADQLVAEYLGASHVGFADVPYGAGPPGFPSDEDRMSYLEFTRYMQSQLLRESDVMSMTWGLELRVPLVDKAVMRSLSQILGQLDGGRQAISARRYAGNTPMGRS